MDMREEIAFMNTTSWLRGLERQIDISVARFRNNETPDLTQLEKFGYATKGPYHVARMDEMLTNFIEGKDYWSIMQCSPERLIPIKRGVYSREEVETTMMATIEKIRSMMERIPASNPKFAIMYKMEKLFKEFL
jgi:hypothetical protein